MSNFNTASQATGTLTKASINAGNNFGRELASKAITSYGAYSSGSFTAGTTVGSFSPFDANSLSISNNPLTAPFELGLFTGSTLTETYNTFTKP